MLPNEIQKIIETSVNHTLYLLYSHSFLSLHKFVLVICHYKYIKMTKLSSVPLITYIEIIHPFKLK